MIIKSGENIALRSGEKNVSYKELIQKIHLFSERIKKKQGRAIIFSENREAWVYSFFACWNQAIIPVPVDFLSTSEDVRYIINDCRPEVIFCSSLQKPIIDEALYGLSLSPEIIILDHYESVDASKFPSEISFKDNPHDTAVIIYTSGTTGKAKGVMLSFENLQTNIDAVCKEIRIFMPDDRVLMLLPVHHILPLLGTVVMPLTVGCTIAISPSMAPEEIIKTLKENKITLIIGVPRLYAAIRKGIKDKIEKSAIAKMLFSLAEKISSKTFSKKVFGTVHKKFGGNIKYMISGGAALDPAIAKDFRTLGFEILEGYGLTEAAPIISFARPGIKKLGTPGQLLSKVQAEIRDNEIVVKGPNIMQGYFEKPEATAEVLKDGWLHTGDLGYFDQEGYLFITGRKKEIIILSNGKNINPVEIEEKLESISHFVKEAAVFQDGDSLKAVVVPNFQKLIELQADEIEKYFNKNVLQVYNQSVAPYKMLVQLTISNTDLPRTRLGKIQRFLLPALLTEKIKKIEKIEDLEIEEFQIFKKYFKEEKKVNIQPSHHLIINLGLDSLDRVSLQVFIETTFGISIEMKQLTSFENIQQLCEFIHEHKKHTVFEKINWSLILKQKINLKLPSSWITSNIIVKISHLFFTLLFRFQSKGSSNIPNEPFIIVANHQSFFDGLLVASSLKFKQMNRTFFYAKEKHLRNPLIKFFAKRNNIIIMDLNHNLKESIQKMAEVLKRRKNLIIFPEGTRTVDGSLGDFKKTFAILSSELNVPIVPVSIQGAYEVLPRGKILPKLFRKIRIEYFKPIYPDGHTYDSLSDKVRSVIEEKLEKQKCC